MEQVRTIAQGLVSAEIHVHGLVSALERLAADTQQRSGIGCRCLCASGASVEDTATAAQLFRIAQEAVNNAVKHGQAKSIVMELKSGDGRIAIEVRDDGVGIRCDVTQTAGMGLRVMQHRADVIGATLRIRSAETGGTLVRCTLPRDN
jgi:two-component system CheB/CheR fusion protein